MDDKKKTDAFNDSAILKNAMKELNIACKTLNRPTAMGATEIVPDIEIWGDGDTFKLISKALSKSEGWMKSTKAMEIPDVGCVVQVTHVAEALSFVPGVRIDEQMRGGAVIGRSIVKI